MQATLLRLVPYVLVIDGVLLGVRGLNFIRYASESRFALVGVVVWLGIAILSLRLSVRFRRWAALGFPHIKAAVASIGYAYVVLAVAVGLSLELVGSLFGVEALQTGGDEPNRLSSAIGLTVSGISLTMALITVLALFLSRSRWASRPWGIANRGGGV